jgi:hypothetical protein
MNPALAEFGSMEARLRNDPNAPANQDFEDALYGKSVDELKAMAASGQHLPRVQRDVLYALLGNRTADDWSRDLPQWYAEEFDKTNGNLDREIQQRAQVAADGLPSDAAKAAFWKATEGPVQRFLAADTERNLVSAADARDTAVLSTFRNIATDALHRGTPAGAIANQIFATASTLKAFKAVDGKAQNAILMAYVKELASQGHEDLVNALLDAPRDGAGPLGKIASFTQDSIDARETARRQRYRLTTENTQEPYVDLQVRARTTGDVTDEALTDWEAQYGPLDPATKNALREQNDVTLARLASERRRHKRSSTSSAPRKRPRWRRPVQRQPRWLLGRGMS